MRAKTLLSAIVLFTLAVTFTPEMGGAQTKATPMLTAEANRMDHLAAKQGPTKVIDKLSAEFSSFLGADAKAVVIGLRNGTDITLTTPGPVPGTFETIVIDPPTGKMGFGNVFITLALAQHQYGSATPIPPDQLNMLLTGDQGILTLRSQNMGWGQIAQQYGTKLGFAVSSLKSANHALASGAVAPSRGGAAAGSGIVTGQGKVVGKSPQGVSGTSKGIVTGSGRPVGGLSGITTGSGRAYGLSGSGPGSARSAKGQNR